MLENEAAGLGFFGNSAPAQPAEKGMPGMMGSSLPGYPGAGMMGMPGGMPGMGAQMEAEPTQAPPVNPNANVDAPGDAPALGTPTTQPVNSGAEEVVVLEATLAAVEAKLELVKSQHASGVTATQELQDAEAAVNIAKARLAKARREYEAQERLLQLDLKRAQLGLRRAEAELAEAMQTNQKTPGTIPASTLIQKEVAAKQAAVSVERAKTLLDLNRKADPSKVQPPKEPAPKETPPTS